jgi:hypothetical protein
MFFKFNYIIPTTVASTSSYIPSSPLYSTTSPIFSVVSGYDPLLARHIIIIMLSSIMPHHHTAQVPTFMVFTISFQVSRNPMQYHHLPLSHSAFEFLQEQ